MASSGLGTAAGGLDPSRNGEGFGPTPTACSETSGGVSAPAPDQGPAAAAAKNPASDPAPGQPGRKKRRPNNRSNKSNIGAPPPPPDLDGVPGFWRRAPSGHSTGTLAHAPGSAGYTFTSVGNQSWSIDEATAGTYASDQRRRAPANPASAHAALVTRKEPRDKAAHRRALAKGKQPRDAALHAAANGYGKAPRSDVAAAERQLVALPMAEAPAMCYSFAISKIKACAPNDAATLLTNAFRDMCTEHEREQLDSAYLGTLSDGTFHHNVAERVLREGGQRFERVDPVDYDRLHAAKSCTFAVYGKLNIDGFNPCAGGGWSIPKCRTNKFYGLESVEGEVNHDYHVVIVRKGAMHCMNLVDDRDRPFSLSARTVLPLTKPSRDGQRRILAGNKHAYLTRIQRVFEVVDASEAGGAAAAPAAADELAFEGSDDMDVVMSPAPAEQPGAMEPAAAAAREPKRVGEWKDGKLLLAVDADKNAYKSLVQRYLAEGSSHQRTVLHRFFRHVDDARNDVMRYFCEAEMGTMRHSLDRIKASLLEKRPAIAAAIMGSNGPLAARVEAAGSHLAVMGDAIAEMLDVIENTCEMPPVPAAVEDEAGDGAAKRAREI